MQSVIKKTVHQVLEEKVTCERKDTIDIKSSEPIQLGKQNVVKGWLQNYLKSSGSESATEDIHGELHDREIDLEYELHITVF